ncbi:MAG: cheR [Myxococcales bacterium]|nr:cheR [Myxococcales bacterium]
MFDSDGVAFLQWALPRLHLRWEGFRRMHRQVCRRIDRRRAELGLPDLAAYRVRLDEHPEEWRVLDGLCRVTVSRFARDWEIWSELAGHVLPQLAKDAADAGRTTVRAWSAGCGAGEEPFTLAIAWMSEVAPAVAIDVLGTDVDAGQLQRAAAAIYPTPPLRELPDHWRRVGFEPAGDQHRVRDPVRAVVSFERRDVRDPPPPGPFDLVLCRNAAFTYLDEAVQRDVAAAFRSVLRDGGVLVVGIDEHVPDGVLGLAPRTRSIYLATTSDITRVA